MAELAAGWVPDAIAGRPASLGDSLSRRRSRAAALACALSNPKVKEEIVRALSVPWAKPAATAPLTKQFRLVDASVDPTGMGLRWVIGNALDVLFDDVTFDALAELAEDRSYGKARQMIVLGPGRSMPTYPAYRRWSGRAVCPGRTTHRRRASPTANG